MLPTAGRPPNAGKTLAVVFLAFFAVVSAGAYSPPRIPPDLLRDLRAPVIILGDAETGTILAERNPDVLLPPASLAKLMTLHLSLQDVDSGLLDDDRVYPVPSVGTASEMRRGSSVLGLSTGDRATLLTLMRAAAAVSANDAAWSLASLSSGGRTGDFVARMNAEARRLAMKSTSYADPDGWSSLSVTTGRDQWIFSRYYLHEHPGALKNLHSLSEMEYHEGDFLVSSPQRRNTNLLIGRYPGADGLKTGTTPEAGFHFIATARRGETRLIALVMGIRPGDYIEGLRIRALEAEALLDMGFAACETWRPKEPVIPPVPVRHGAEGSLRVRLGNPPAALTVDKGASSRIESSVELPNAAEAPIAEGDRIGTVSWILDGGTIAAAPLIAVDAVDRRWRLKDFLGL